MKTPVTIGVFQVKQKHHTGMILCDVPFKNFN
nr:MAG TPA: hypothetical protein [Caudoviricetes sp.]